MLEERADNLFGRKWNERMLKDYNAQSYWLSANLKSFFPESNLPTCKFYLAANVDLTKIKTNSKFLNTAFYMLNCLKFPAPAIMIDNMGKVKGYLLYF